MQIAVADKVKEVSSRIFVEDRWFVTGDADSVIGNFSCIHGNVRRLEGIGHYVEGDVDIVRGSKHRIIGNVKELYGDGHIVVGNVDIIDSCATNVVVYGTVIVDKRIRSTSPTVNICAVSGPGAVNTGTVFVSQVQHFGTGPHTATTATGSVQEPSISANTRCWLLEPY